MKIPKAAGERAENPAVPDRHETVDEMEPMLIGEGSKYRSELTPMAFELATKAAGFRRSVPAGILAALRELVRSMNCYYSNLIEGHDTHPIEIEPALKGNYSNDPRKRNLQLEAKAHITVQKWIDEGNLRGRATTVEGIREIHRRFCEHLPPDLLWIENPDTHERLPVVAGEFRLKDVKVGRHVPVSPGAVPRFMERFERVYTGLNKVESLLAAAAAHHRLAWIHAFLDGNGRVARLMSHATLLETLDSEGVWSIARGLARKVDTYKELLANCDRTRRNDLDGRGNLSEEALVDFTRFFLRMCIDQVEFMEKLVDPRALRARIQLWVQEEAALKRMNPKAASLLDAILYRGEVPRGEVAQILGLSTRYSRQTVTELAKEGVVASETPYGPLRIVFTAKLAPRWMPGLFPQASSDN